MFSSMLVANRGEIASRVIRSAKKMGIRCVAIYIEADKNAPYLTHADQSIKLESTYLDIDAIINAAKMSGSEAIHPGYGFLSENAKFAKSVEQSGLIWIGPSANVISKMGDKLKAKEIADSAGVPTLSIALKKSEIDSIGFPLLVKASAGGGGKGMRIVNNEDELDESIKMAKMEALNAFADDTVFFESYIQQSRHIEIQILGDNHGNIIHLGERECSIQRRHQKIIEESPSPRIDSNLREQLGSAAVSLAKKIDYQSAGTVEFLFDDATGKFWFLEMNTRLQVEHPVTETVTGIDIVEQQLLIAANQEMLIDQQDVFWSGHAIEARIYAEDPSNDFLPSTGKLIANEIKPKDGIRWDSGVETGMAIGTDFDPMMAKVIAYGTSRSEASRKLAKELESTHFGGFTTNIEFLANILRHEEFIDGNTTTDFIDRVNPPRSLILEDLEKRFVAIKAALWLQALNRSQAVILENLPSGWNNARLPIQRITFEMDSELIEIHYKSNRDGSFTVDNKERVTLHYWSESEIDIEIDGMRAISSVTLDDNKLLVQCLGGNKLLIIQPRFEASHEKEKPGSLVSPMPGKVVELNVNKGDQVQAGDNLLSIEAMKMNHIVKANEDGVIAEVFVQKDDQVNYGAVLMIIKSEA
ncbi:MAG: carbamoyl-phosphate synthase L chain ATP-binding protein [Rhodospirillaceae bacterium]|nr:carbamoyl-phosphate synthase L chain ATP-binding protein [Rhodospirillaceae bacterium]